MRLAEVERGDTLRARTLIRLISRVARMRLPDAARVAFYDHDFVGSELGTWTHATMRGPSDWTVSERELMASMVASWNSCPFCVGAHASIAVIGMDPHLVDACIADYRTADISPRLRAALVFLETMTLRPAELTGDTAALALAGGMSTDALADAAAVGAIFNIITRYANALDFTIPSDEDYAKSARMLLRRGYK